MSIPAHFDQVSVFAVQPSELGMLFSSLDYTRGWGHDESSHSCHTTLNSPAWDPFIVDAL